MKLCSLIAQILAQVLVLLLRLLEINSLTTYLTRPEAKCLEVETPKVEVQTEAPLTSEWDKPQTMEAWRRLVLSSILITL